MINFTQHYQDFLDNGDPRVASWPMMDSPMKAITLVVMYLGFVKVVGPAWMRDQKPYELRIPMIVYNFLLVAISTWIFFNVAYFDSKEKMNSI
ncbi:elongation of very long chain fatty acids protein [Caerostris extrusa]|uniref:Elongation of very long chain fatty acids protein n=1 Tax=Caerostris extrusa TaxID=172846 RepID=A0AAV4MPR6_CAEEX|nr:elongation of very long chain fatty acids protein [Caerostris extrusa]